MKPIKVIATCSLAIALSLCPAYAAQKATAPPHRPAIQRVQYGVASWYGREDQGRLMACGERFNEYAMVAANRTLPLGTAVKVTNLRNGRSVVVRIKDRGPGVRSRIIDLSRAAAERLDFVHRGLAPVKVRVLTMPRERRTVAKQRANRYSRETAVGGQ
jgi:rare lipoprotein A